jgi:hypothetical protein
MLVLVDGVVTYEGACEPGVTTFRTNRRTIVKALTCIVSVEDA